MVFSSTIFLGIFLPLFLICYFMIPNRKVRNVTIVIFSLFFYSWGEPVWVMGMIVLVFVDYVLALNCNRIKSDKVKKLFMVFTVVSNLAMLFVFKYYNFFIDNINGILNTSIPELSLTMPIGISFFTFQALTYVVDVYRKEVEPQKNYLNVLLYISMFPQLIAGPIVRYCDVAKQIKDRKETVDGFNSGMFRFSIGLCKKVIFANYAGLIATSLLNGEHLEALTTGGAWLGMVMFLCQLYFDFSGYSDMAIGLGKVLGFTYKENFNYPYISKSVTELWRRWHISLGQFFREYVYIPLGGNRKHQIFNVIVVWLLTGLWHGASWNYVLWGVYFVAFLLLERLLRKIHIDISGIPVVSNIALLLIIIFGWSIFYFNDFGELQMFLQSMLGLKNELAMQQRELTPVYQYFYVVIVMIIGCTPLPKKLACALFPEGRIRTDIAMGICGSVFFALCYLLLLKQSFNPFLYFRF